MKTFIICGLMKNNSKYIKIYKNRIEKLYNLKNLKLLMSLIHIS